MAGSSSSQWSRSEDEALCRAYLLISEDPMVGTGQAESRLWTRVQAKMYDIYNGPTLLKRRSIEGINCRWKKYLYPAMNKWNQALLEARRCHATGTNLVDERRAAEMIYMTNNKGKQFQYHHCWEVCKNWVCFQEIPTHHTPTSEVPPIPTPTYQDPQYPPSFNPLQPPQYPPSFNPLQPPEYPPSFNLGSDNDYSTPVTVEDDIDDQHNTPKTYDTAEQSSVRRPTGRNKAKRKEKGKETSISMVDEQMMEHMRYLKEAQQKAEADKAERHRQIMMHRQQERDDRIMAMDTSVMTPDTRQYFRDQKNEIRNRTRRNLFRGDDFASGANSTFPDGSDFI